MHDRYPEIEPYEQGMLDVGDGQRIYWDVSGNPHGKPAVVLHGGPGSTCWPSLRRYFDPSAYRIVLFDQRGCGRSTPNAADHDGSLETNTTQHLVGDIERLRDHLGIEKWLVFGGSWGSTLGLAYAEKFSERVTEWVMVSIVTTSRREVQWLTRDVGRYFPEEWSRFRDGVPASDRDGDLCAAYYRLLNDGDPAVREQAARNWCDWEDVHVTVRGKPVRRSEFEDSRYRMTFARLVTHYFHHSAWLPDGELLREAGRLGGIPAVLVHGRLDLSGPLDVAWQLSRAWPGSKLVVIEDAGHGTRDAEMISALVEATDRFRT